MAFVHKSLKDLPVAVLVIRHHARDVVHLAVEGHYGKAVAEAGVKTIGIHLVGSFITTLTYCFRGIMPPGRRWMPRKSPFRIDLTLGERSKLESIARKYTCPYYSVVRAKIVLLAARGMDNNDIGRRLDVPREVVSKWRKRFFEERLAGLEDRPRRGRPPVFSPSG